eukprot:TRINITY_DN16956_c0_g1_i6.p1 TRINITY_DN16956_c0_g1~~TRINITY_DN16956_c0_g1_i6.p1  ORF type:complete len:552 (-),score=73.58 TRINITY_DN16956_c0_g1_i6:1323-2978(-)
MRRIPGMSEQLYLLTWDDSYLDFRAWVETNPGRDPKTNGSATEERLSAWLTISRAKFREGKLESERLGKLRNIPGMSQQLYLTKPEHASLPAWEPFDRLKAWMEKHGGKLPSQGKGVDAEERTIYGWLYNTCSKANRNQLGPQKLELLRSVPLIAQRLRKKTAPAPAWKAFDSLKTWMDKHGGNLPSKSNAVDAEEKEHYEWLCRTLSKANRHQLVPHKLKMLQSVPSIAHRLNNEPSLNFTKARNARSFAWGAFDRLKAWMDKHGGKLPSDSDKVDAEERTNYQWLCNMCSKADRNWLVPHKLKLLQSVPCIAQRLRNTPTLDENYRRRGSSGWAEFDRLLIWMDKHNGTLPSKHGNVTDEERSNYDWLHVQCLKARRRELVRYKLRHLLRLPGIAQRLLPQSKGQKNETRESYAEWSGLDELLNWLGKHGGRLPSRQGQSSEEKNNYRWLCNVTRAARNGLLSKDRLAVFLSALSIAEGPVSLLPHKVHNTERRSLSGRSKLDMLLEWIGENEESASSKQSHTLEVRINSTKLPPIIELVTAKTTKSKT